MLKVLGCSAHSHPSPVRAFTLLSGRDSRGVFGMHGAAGLGGARTRQPRTAQIALNEPFEYKILYGLWAFFRSVVVVHWQRQSTPRHPPVSFLKRYIVCAETIPSAEATSFSRGISLRFIHRTPIAGCAIERRTQTGLRVGFFLLFFSSFFDN